MLLSLLAVYLSPIAMLVTGLWTWKLWRDTKVKRAIIVLGLAIGFLLASYGGLIERFWIYEKEIELEIGLNEEVKVALLADLQLGVFKDKFYLQNVIERVNKIEDLDLVLIPGDLIYHAKAENLDRHLSSFKEIKVPVYSVLGNHDHGYPGVVEKDLSKEVNQWLEENGIGVTDNRIFDVQVKNSKFKLVGIGDLNAGNSRVEILEELKEEETVVVLTHNPDVADLLPKGKADLMVAGHTHCGQIQIPFIYKYAIPTVGDYDGGYMDHPNTQLYISCGLGEGGLPIRLFNRPELTVMTLK